MSTDTQPTVWVQDDRHSAYWTKVYLSQPDGRLGWNTEEVPLFGDLEGKQHAYAIKVIYTTGSTFGSESGLVTTAAIAADDDAAIRIKNAIEKNAKTAKPKYTIEVDGVEIYCGRWTGYFERLEYVTVELVEVVNLP